MQIGPYSDWAVFLRNDITMTLLVAIPNPDRLKAYHEGEYSSF